MGRNGGYRPRHHERRDRETKMKEGIAISRRLAMLAAAGLATLTIAGAVAGDALAQRSEEHTSELQSLVRISYAVFCLKKKKQEQIQLTIHHTLTTGSTR